MSVVYDLGVLKHFGTENQIGRLDIVQNLDELCQFFLYDILDPECFNISKSYTTVHHLLIA